MWEMGKDIDTEDESDCTNQYQQPFLQYEENKYFARYRPLLVTKSEKIPNNHVVSPTPASRSGQSSCDPYDMPSNGEDCGMSRNVAVTTPGRSDHAVHILASARIHLHLPWELPQHCGHINQNINDYHSYSMGM
jgi:hypothetical protein